MSDERISDATLVAFLHGEFPADERRAFLTRLRGDADAKARLAALEQVAAAVDEALDRDASPLARGRGNSPACCASCSRSPASPSSPPCSR